MKDGRNFVETLKLSGVTRHQDLVEPGMPKAIYGSDPQMPWLAREFEVPSAPARPERAPAKCKEKCITPHPLDDAPQDKGAATTHRPARSSSRAVPTLRKRKLKVSARVPRILPVKLTPEPKKEEELIKAEVVEVHLPAPVQESAVELSEKKPAFIEPPEIQVPLREVPSQELPLMELPPHVQVKVIPTPRKRGPRTIVCADEPTTPPVAKPLKVIRKRKAEEPKVFETAPKPVPQAMLEGIKTSQENGDQID